MKVNVKRVSPGNCTIADIGVGDFFVIPPDNGDSSNSCIWLRCSGEDNEGDKIFVDLKDGYCGEFCDDETVARVRVSSIAVEV